MQREVLDRLWDKLRSLDSGDAVLFAVPGNHDLYRPLIRSAAVDMLTKMDGFDHISAEFWDNPACDYRRAVAEVFSSYSKWWSSNSQRPSKIVTGILPGDISSTLSIGKWRIGIAALNTTFLQLSAGEYRGRLNWDIRQLDAICEGAVDDWVSRHHLCLLLTHQGPEWLTPFSRKHGETEIAPIGRFAAHLYGHMHDPKLQYIRRFGDKTPYIQCQGCSLFGMEKEANSDYLVRSHGYAAGEIDFHGPDAVMRFWPRFAGDEGGPWRFRPDNRTADLLSNGDTSPERIPVRQVSSKRKKGKLTDSSIIAEVAPPDTDALHSGTPHSTLPARQLFFGRARELEIIASTLNQDRVGWGVVLDGPGGIGKTALAIEAAHRAPSELYPLKLFITAKTDYLHPEGVERSKTYSAETYDMLLKEIGRALGDKEILQARKRDRANLVKHALAAHKTLIIIDNLESFSAIECRKVYDLLEFLPLTCRAIITSRRESRVLALTLRIRKLEKTACDELVTRLTENSSHKIELSDEEQRSLYVSTGGNPALLTWIVGQSIVGHTSIQHALTLLQEAGRENDPLEYIFGHLVLTFSTQETEILAVLAHFSKPASRDWLLSITRLTEAQLEEGLDALGDRALLITNEVADAWQLPPLAATYFRHCRAEAVQGAGGRLVDLVYTLVVTNGGQVYDQFKILEQAWPMIEAALPLLSGNNSYLQIVCDLLKHFFNFSGRWSECLEWSLRAEFQAKLAGDFVKAGWRAYDAGWIHFQRGEAKEMHDCAKRAEEHWSETIVGTHERASVLRLRSLAHRQANEYDAALRTGQEALQMWLAQSPDSIDVATALHSIAETLRHAREFEDAEQKYWRPLR